MNCTEARTGVEVMDHGEGVKIDGDGRGMRGRKMAKWAVVAGCCGSRVQQTAHGARGSGSGTKEEPGMM